MKDKEENVEIDVYVDYHEKGEYPPYLFYNNVTRTLTFRPHSVWYQGIQYMFEIVIKERGSDS